MQYRQATDQDVEAIAALHADSWRRTYRGSYSDDFLDGDVDADRLAVWTDRFSPPADNSCTIVAVNDEAVVGFVHTILDEDPTWGALLDNLHVMHGMKGRGVGTRLMAETAKIVVERRPGICLHLWVLEANTAARAFYDARGGTCVEHALSEPPGGGTVMGLRYVWRDPTVLLNAEP